MGRKEFDDSSIADNLLNQTKHVIVDEDRDLRGEGRGSSREEARTNAERDLEARDIAQRAEEIIKQNR